MLSNIAIIVILVCITRILANIAIWVYLHHTRAGRLTQRFSPWSYSVLPWVTAATVAAAYLWFDV